MPLFVVHQLELHTPTATHLFHLSTVRGVEFPPSPTEQATVWVRCEPGVLDVGAANLIVRWSSLRDETRPWLPVIMGLRVS